MPSWQDLEKHKKKPLPDADAFCMICARLFSTADGKAFLEIAKTMTVEKVLPDTASESALRTLEGERRFVRKIERAHSEGLSLMAQANKEKVA